MSPGARSLRVKAVTRDEDLASAFAIRDAVFVVEQGMASDRDEDDEVAYHVLAVDRGRPVATGRLVELPATPAHEHGRWARIGRMAVVRERRRRGIGGKILAALEHEAGRRGLHGVVVAAQLDAADFYEHRGYAQRGPVFEEEGIPHVEMWKTLVERS